MLSRLEGLALGFRYPQSQAHRASRRTPTPALTRVIFPNLILLNFSGDMEYLEDILSQIEAPVLNESDFRIFNQLEFDTPLLGHFINRTETFMAIHTARVEFWGWAAEITLRRQEEMDDDQGKTLQLVIISQPLDWQLSAVAQILNSFVSSFPTLESLEIAVNHEDWQDDIEVIQLREFLLPFTFVKYITLEDKESVQLIAPVLQELAVERAIDMLPALQDLFVTAYNWQPQGPVLEAIVQFLATRQICNHPVYIHC